MNALCYLTRYIINTFMVGIKLLLFCRHFREHFCKSKLLYLHHNITQLCCYGPVIVISQNWQWTGNKPLFGTNGALVYWCTSVERIAWVSARCQTISRTIAHVSQLDLWNRYLNAGESQAMTQRKKNDINLSQHIEAETKWHEFCSCHL